VKHFYQLLPPLAGLTAFLLLAVMAVAAGIFGISATWAQGNTMQNPDVLQAQDRPALTIPPITAEGYRWANYAAYRIHTGTVPGTVDESETMRVKGGVLQVYYEIACSTTNLNMVQCPAPIRHYTTISCDGTEGGVIVVNLGQGEYSNLQLRPYKLTLTINRIEFVDWNEKYRLPSYCKEGKYMPAMTTVSNQPSPPAVVSVN